MCSSKLPAYKDILPVQGMPHGCVWGMFDIDGEKDQLGTLNWLTRDVVLAARSEIKSGASVSLNWPLECIHDPGHNRNAMVHNILDLEPAGLIGHDDEITINTQTSSQWDSLRHWAHQPTQLYYNGVTHAEISGKDRNLKNGIHEWSKRGGIVGRGVFLDWASWADEKGIKYRADSKHIITVKELEQVAAAQGTEFKDGDILLVRTGWIKWYDTSSQEVRVDGTKKRHEYIGVESTQESIEWIWDHHFSAVAADTMAFEAWPATDPAIRLHDTLLGLWGMPIGELWDFEELAAECKRQKRWTFFLTSSPLNIAGGVASPPNALAIF